MTLVIKKPTGGNLVMAKGQPVPVDPFFGNVVLLLHGDGTNGSTTIVDSSRFLTATTALNGAAISTAGPKFGSGSMLFDGVNDRITANIDITPLFRQASCTVEFWMNPTSNSSIQALFGNRDIGISLQYGTGLIRLIYHGAAIVVSGSSSLITLNNWNHVAVVKSGQNYTIFTNGNASATATSSLLPLNGQTVLSIGQNGSGVGFEPFGGKIDEFRITANIARYTSNFTPPTAPYPDF